MRYLPHTNYDIKLMLNTIGKSKLNDLFQSIPNDLIKISKFNKITPWDEIQIKKFFNEKVNNINLSFIGAGIFNHYVPEIVSQLLLRSEWYTGYTPYQAEVSQGTLQTMFEFQTIISNIYGCDIANASLYDGSTALAEALLMAIRIKQKPYVLISSNIHPEYYKVCKLYLKNKDIEIKIIDYDKFSGTMNLNILNNLLNKYKNKISAVVYQTPNFFGQFESQEEIIKTTHANDALAIAVNIDPLAFGIIKSPGLLNADIVVGEGMGLTGFSGMGGSSVGFFATRKKFLRLIPGRIVGLTKDTNNKRGFVLTASTREQHIRRERATSNICTNSNLNALAFTITLSLYGKKGYQLLAMQNIKNNIYFKNNINEITNIKILYNNNYFNELIIEFPNRDKLLNILKKMEEKNIIGGFDLFQFYPELNKHLLICITEMHNKNDIDTLIGELKQ